MLNTRKLVWSIVVGGLVWLMPAVGHAQQNCTTPPDDALVAPILSDGSAHVGRPVSGNPTSSSFVSVYPALQFEEFDTYVSSSSTTKFVEVRFKTLNSVKDCIYAVTVYISGGEVSQSETFYFHGNDVKVRYTEFILPGTSVTIKPHLYVPDFPDEEPVIDSNNAELSVELEDNQLTVHATEALTRDGVINLIYTPFTVELTLWHLEWPKQKCIGEETVTHGWDVAVDDLLTEAEEAEVKQVIEEDWQSWRSGQQLVLLLRDIEEQTPIDIYWASMQMLHSAPMDVDWDGRFDESGTYHLTRCVKGGGDTTLYFPIIIR